MITNLLREQPTSEECSSNALVYDDDGVLGYAIWFPQLGGYCGKAVAVLAKRWVEYKSGAASGGCIDVYLWHNGDFPIFEHDLGNPAVLHLCDPEQFIEFGETLKRLNDANRVEVDQP